MEKVTVMVLSYHSADTIIETLESVKAQTYQEIELIVADDASKDDSVKISREWIEKHKHRFVDAFVVQHPVNHGIPGNINGVLERVSGKYCKILAADDLLTEDAIMSYVQFIENHKMVLPVGNVIWFSDEDIDLTPMKVYEERCRKILHMDRKQQYHELLIQNHLVAPAGSFYPTELIRDVKGFSEQFRWMEDYPMYLKVMRKGYSFGHLNEEVVKYRISGSSITGGQSQALRQTTMRFFFRRRMWYLIQNGQGMEALKQIPYWVKVLKSK